MFEETSRPMKVALSVLLVALLAVLVLVILTQRGVIGKKTTPVAPVTTSQPQATTKTPPTGAQNQTGNSDQAVSPATSPSISIEEATKQASAIQEQVKAGTISPEEEAKQLNAIGAKFPMPK